MIKLIGIKKVFIILFLIPHFLQAQSKEFEFQVGDLLFQLSDCGNFCEAINAVTNGVNGIDFNHVGILLKGESDEWFVVEAISAGVVETPINSFLEKSLDKKGLPLVAVGRVKQDYLIDYSQLNQLMGRPYDQIFDIENESYYCSELVYLSYKDESGKPLFELNPMTFKDPGTGKTFSIWEKYFSDLNEEIPEGEPGLNPGGISKSEVLQIYFPFSDFKN